MTSVYVFECDGRTKIGIAENVEGRRRSIETGIGLPVFLAGSRVFSSRKSAWTVEQQLHRMFGDMRAIGEWFLLPSARAVEALHSVEVPVEPIPYDGPDVAVPTPTERALAYLADIIDREKKKKRRSTPSRAR